MHEYLFYLHENLSYLVDERASRYVLWVIQFIILLIGSRCVLDEHYRVNFDILWEFNSNGILVNYFQNTGQADTVNTNLLRGLDQS